MIAKGFRPVGWVAAVGAAALCCYMLSLRVASERADLARLDRKIIAAQQNIRALQTEVGTRGRLTQLEEWNDEVLALAAPVSGQFIEGNVSLARFDTRQPPLDQQVRLASAEAPAATPATQAPAPAPAPQHAVAAPAPAQPAHVQPAQVRRASLTTLPQQPPRAEAAPTAKPRAATTEERSRPSATPVRTATTQERSRPAASPARTPAAEERGRPPTAVARAAASVRTAPAPSRAAARAPAARRSAALLNERTVRELGHAARGERERGTGN